MKYITTGVKDLYGNALTAARTWSFTTTAASYTIVASDGANGSITPVGSQSVSTGSTESYTITPNSGYVLSQILLDGGAVTPLPVQDPITLTYSYPLANITANHTIAATFAPATYNLTVNPVANATTTPSGTSTVKFNSTPAIVITPIAGYSLASIKVDGAAQTLPVLTGGTYSYTMSAITANHTVNITMSADINPPVIAATAPANLATGIAQSAVISATFSKSMDPATITDSTFIVKDPGGNAILGTVSYSGLLATFTPTLPLTLNTSYSAFITTGVKDLYGNAMAAARNWSFTTTAASYTVVASDGANGSITPVGSLSVSTGSTESYTITPNSGYLLSQILLDGGAVTPLPVQDPITLTYSYPLANITANHTIAASFAPATYNLTVNPVANATTTPSGTSTVKFNSTPAIVITPIAGYSLASIKVDGAAQTLPVLTGGTYSYTMSAITANHTVNITMSTDINPPVIAATAPANLATGIAQSAVISATFSKSMDPATITDSTFIVKDPGGNAILGTVSYSGLLATFTPTLPLTLNTSYSAFITTGVKDLYSNAMAAARTWSFTTTAASYTVAASVGANGSITPVGSLTVSTGSTENYKITPNSGYVLSQILLDGGAVTPLPVQDPFTLTYSYPLANITANHTIAASFAPATYNLTVNPVANATTTPSGTSTAKFNSTPAIVITPIAGYSLASIKVYGSAQTLPVLTGGTYSYTMSAITANHTVNITMSADINPPAIAATAPANLATGIAQSAVISATFSKSMDPATITDSTFIVKDPGGNAILGTVSYSGLVATFTPTLPLTLNTSYSAFITTGVKDLYGNALTAANIWSFTTRSNVHNVQLAVGINGVVTSNPADLTKVADGSNVTFTITPEAGNATLSSYKLAGISVDGTAVTQLPSLNANGTTLTYTVTNVITDLKITVVFTKIQHIVTATSKSNGTVTGLPVLDSNSEVTINDGASMTLSFIPKTGYFLTSITENGTPLNLATRDPKNPVKAESANADGTYTWAYTITAVKSDIKIIATFSNQCIISVTPGIGGTLSPGSTINSCGGSKLFTIIPNTGYTFSSLTVNGVPEVLTDPVNSTYLLTNITANVSINAEFTPYPYQLNIEAPKTGTGVVNPSGAVYMNLNGTKTIEINPANGYALSSITFNGQDVTPANPPAGSYTFTTPPVTTNSILAIAFKIMPDGDVNLDGKFDLSDIVLALQIAVGTRIATSNTLSHGDVGPINAQLKPVPDGKIDIDDVVVLLQRMVGNIPAW